MKKRRLLTVALIASALVVVLTALVERHRAHLQRGLLERAIQSQSVAPEGVDPDDAQAAPAGVPAEFWESYYSDAGP